MKPQSSNNRAISNLEASQVSEFSIKAEAIPFIVEMLSSRLYVDPIMAMVRETITNALDAGGLSPIEITLDRSQENLCIYSVRDSGPGMSRDCVENVLSKLGESTKSGDNQQHGGYGIGFLSIFAAAKQATISTVCDGICYQYLLFRNERGVPVLNLLSQSATDQIGTTITVALGEPQYEDLHKAISWFVLLTKAKIIYSEVKQSGFRQVFPNKKLSFVGDQCELREIYWTHGPSLAQVDIPVDVTGACIIVRAGAIPYKLSREQTILVTQWAMKLTQTETEISLIKALIKSTVDFAAVTKPLRASPHLPHLFLALNLEIGQLELPGSREEILCNDQNNELIATALVESVRQIQATYRQRFLEQEDVSLDLKVRIVQSFQLKTFLHEGIRYQLKDLWQRFAYCEFSSTGNLKTEYSYWFNHLNQSSPEPLVVLINLRSRKQLSTIIDLLEKLPDSSKYRHCLGKIKFLCYASSADYLADLARDPFLALALKDAPVLVDPGPTPRTPKSAEDAQKARERRAAVRSAKYLNNNPVLRLGSLQELGFFRQRYPHQSMSLTDIAGEAALFNRGSKVSLPPQPLEQVIYLEVGRSNGLQDLLVFSSLCARMEWDTPVHFIPVETLDVLKNIYPQEQLIKIEDWIDGMTQLWVVDHLPLIHRIGFFPGLNIRAVEAFSEWMREFDADSSRSTQINLDRLLSDAAILQVAQPGQIADLKAYLTDFDLWQLIVESGYSLRLFRTCLLFVAAIKESSIAIALDRDLHRTVAYLLNPVLKQIPMFDFIKISLDRVPIDQFLASVKTLVEKYDPSNQ